MKPLRPLGEISSASPIPRMEQIEWSVCKIARDGSRIRHSEGAQRVFGLTRARSIVKLLGEGWHLRHWIDDHAPAE